MKDAALILLVVVVCMGLFSEDRDSRCYVSAPIFIHPEDEFYCDVLDDRGTEDSSDDVVKCPTLQQIQGYNYDYEQDCEID